MRSSYSAALTSMVIDLCAAAVLVSCPGCGGTVEANDHEVGDAGFDEVGPDAFADGSLDSGMDAVDEQLACTVDEPNLVQAAIHACSPGCCDEGSTACLAVTVDGDGIIIDVAATDEGLPVDLPCALARLLGECSPFSGETVTLCAQGV